MDIFFDEDHDATLLDRDLRFTSEDEDVKQRLTIYLQFLFAEWFLSTSVGIPYTQTIFELVSNNLNVAYTIIRGEVKNIEGVITIDELTIDLNEADNELTVLLVVNKTISAEVTI